MISRVAESCFWLNRHLERVEVLARMLDVNLAFQLDVDLPDAERWRPLVVVTGQDADFTARTPADRIDDPDEVQHYLSWDEDNPISLRSALRAARENARTIRETISLELFEALNDLWVWLGQRPARRLYEDDRHAFYARIRDQCLLLHGIAQATMLHEDPFEFMRLGTALERISQTARILDVTHHSITAGSGGAEETPSEVAQWMAILRFCSGVEPFLKREKEMSGSAIADFLMFEPSFARSIRHNVDRALNFHRLVCPPAPSTVGADSRAELEAISRRLTEGEATSVPQTDLHAFLTDIVDATAEVCATIDREFFDPPVPSSG